MLDENEPFTEMSILKNVARKKLLNVGIVLMLKYLTLFFNCFDTFWIISTKNFGQVPIYLRYNQTWKELAYV